MWLPASGAGGEWALYSFTGLAGGDTLAQLEVTLTDDLPAQYWVGLGDYALKAWRWVRVEPEGTDGLDVRSLTQPVSAGGAFHVVVLAFGADPARIAQLKLYINLPPLPPTHVVAEKGTQPGEFVLSWEKAEGATGYEIYRDSQSGTFATVGDVDTWTDTAAGEQDRTYWLKAVNEHGTSAFSEPASGQQEPWQIQLIDPEGRYSTSLAVVDGKPAFTIVNRYYRALTATPSSREDWEMHLFDEEADIAGPAPLIEYNGVPYMVYIDYDRDVLRFARGLSATPSAGGDWDISTIDEFDIVDPGEYAVAFISGRPAVCYQRRDGIEESGDLCLAHADNVTPAGPADWQIHVIDDIPGYPAGVYKPDLGMLASNVPTISYIVGGADYQELRFAVSNMAVPTQQSDWAIHTIVDNMHYIGMSTSVILVEGKPSICFLNSGKVYYAASKVGEPLRAEDWGIETLIPFEALWYKPLRLLNGRPTVSLCVADGLFMATRQ